MFPRFVRALGTIHLGAPPEFFAQPHGLLADAFTAYSLATDCAGPVPVLRELFLRMSCTADCASLAFLPCSALTDVVPSAPLPTAGAASPCLEPVEAIGLSLLSLVWKCLRAESQGEQRVLLVWGTQFCVTISSETLFHIYFCSVLPSFIVGGQVWVHPFHRSRWRSPRLWYFLLLFSFKHIKFSITIDFNLRIIHIYVFKFPKGMSFKFFSNDFKLNALCPM